MNINYDAFLYNYVTSYFHSELPPTTLAEILAPNSLMTNNKFELTVDEWKFVGHPFSVQNKNFSIAFNIVFVLQVSVYILIHSYLPEAITSLHARVHM